MKSQNIAGVLALSGMSATALYAAQPPIATSVQSDGFYNTAMGQLALGNDVTPGTRCVPYSFNQSTFAISGCANTATGFAALDQNQGGGANTATGAGALYANTSGSYNTAVGMIAMFHTSSGSDNTAIGTSSMFSNTTGQNNVATGYYSLYRNATGSGNTALGNLALFSSTASDNTALGANAGAYTTSGAKNLAAGAYALNGNTTGTGNVALGYQALVNSTSSSYNIAVGYQALNNNASTANAGNNIAIGSVALYQNAGIDNIGIGASTLASVGSGVGNTVVGTSAASGMSGGSYNTVIGYGVALPSGSNYVTSIGVSTLDPAVTGTPTTYISGIYGTVLSGATMPVVINANGQLGMGSASSERFKTDIATLGADGGQLLKLRPVSFHLKNDPQGALQYGLIAEEVDKVLPALVVRDPGGQIQGVRYDELAPLLLGELQRQQSTIAAQSAEISELRAQNAATAQQLAALAALKQELDALLQAQQQGSALARR